MKTMLRPFSAACLLAAVLIPSIPAHGAGTFLLDTPTGFVWESDPVPTLTLQTGTSGSGDWFVGVQFDIVPFLGNQAQVFAVYQPDPSIMGMGSATIGFGPGLFTIEVGSTLDAFSASYVGGVPNQFIEKVRIEGRYVAPTPPPPGVPDGGSTLVLLGLAAMGVAGLRRQTH